MSRMSPEQLAELADELGRSNPAAPEFVLAAVRWKRAGHHEDASRVVLPMARNLLDAETELAVFRTVVARLLAENDRGDDHSLADLRDALQRVGVDLTPEYAAAEDIVRATESESL